MTQIDNLSDFADQQTIMILDDGTTAALDLVYNASAERWVISISHAEKIVNGIGLCAHPNILRQWKNVLPFGLACVTPDQTDPFDINDFVSGRVKIYLLNRADVRQVETDVFTAP